MKKAIFLLLVILVSSFSNVGGSGGQVDITLGYPEEVPLNKEFDIKFEIFNNSNDRIWDGALTIEKDFLNKYGDYINSKTDYSSNPFKYVVFGPGYKVNDAFKLSFKDDFPEDKVTFNIIFEGKKGSCRCDSNALYIKKEVTIVVKKDPRVLMNLNNDFFEVYQGEDLIVPFTIKNTGDITLINLKVFLFEPTLNSEIIEIPSLPAGKEISSSLIITTSNENKNMSFTPTIVASFTDSSGKENRILKGISIKVNDIKPVINEESTKIENTEQTKNNINLLGTNIFLLILPLVSLLVIILSYLLLLRKGN